MLPFVRAGGSELRFVEGPYGRGKTHLLLAMQAVAAEQGFVTCRVDCGLQQKPFQSFAETYQAVAQRVQGPGLNGRLGVCSLLEASSQEALQQYRDKARHQHPAFVNLALAYARRLSVGRANDELPEDLRALLHHDRSRYVTFSQLYRQAPDLKGQIGRVGKRNAAVWLRSMLTLPRGLGYPGLVVFFDETMADLHVGSGRSRQLQEHFAHLRQLVDRVATGGLPGCAIVYATTSDLIRLARDHYEALHQRVARLADSEPPPPNPRAVWCRLDELTVPDPSKPQFFEELGSKLVQLGLEAGITSSHCQPITRQIPILAQRFSIELTQGAVRDFVKSIASQLLCQT